MSTPEWENNSMNPWKPDDDPQQARRLGKTVEELGELLGVIGRIQIQGMDAIDPSSGKTNRQRLHEETADVYAQLDCNVVAFHMDQEALRRRTAVKVGQMDDWEAHYGPAP